MRRVSALSSAALSLVAILLFSGSAAARPWHGLTPGVSTKSEVMKKFGSPNRELPMTPAHASGLVYQAKEATDYGAEEAQFFFDASNKLSEIYVFPAVALKRDDIIKAYGTAYEERRTDDFRLYFQYKADGFVVFFDKDNESVFQLQFIAPAAPSTTPPTAASAPANTGVAPAATAAPPKTATANPPK